MSANTRRDTRMSPSAPPANSLDFEHWRGRIDWFSKELEGLTKGKPFNLDDIPKSGGVYHFIQDNQSMYVGSGQNIHTRVKQQLSKSYNEYQNNFAISLAKEAIAFGPPIDRSKFLEVYKAQVNAQKDIILRMHVSTVVIGKNHQEWVDFEAFAQSILRPRHSRSPLPPKVRPDKFDADTWSNY